MSATALGRVTTPRTRRSLAPGAGAAVPWVAVLSLAVVLAAVAGFWMVSLRGAVGAIERTDDPFEAWLRESSLMLPFFVLAVLAAFALSLRRRGAARRSGSTAVTGLLLVGAATVVGVAMIAASAAYDYHLQWSMSREMSEMTGGCVDCLAADQQATLALQVKAVAYGAAILLASNVVVVAWLWALRGGRLDAGTVRARRRGGAADRRTPRPARRSRQLDLRVVLATCLLGGAAIHAAVTPEHLEEWRLAGLFFIVLAAGQLAAGAAVLLRPGAAGLGLAAAVSLLPVMVWAVSRTTGLPLGPEAGAPEEVGLADAAALALEVAALLLVVVVARAGSRLREVPAAGPHALALTVLTVLCVVSVGLGGSGVEWLDVTVAPDGDAGH